MMVRFQTLLSIASCATTYWTPETGFVKYYSPEWDADDYVGTEVGRCRLIPA